MHSKISSAKFAFCSGLVVITSTNQKCFQGETMSTYLGHGYIITPCVFARFNYLYMLYIPAHKSSFESNWFRAKESNTINSVQRGSGTLIFCSANVQPLSNTVHYTSRMPVGVAGLITPWNLPLYLLTFKIAPAIATGNTVVAKPSEMTSVTAWLLGRVLNEAGKVGLRLYFTMTINSSSPPPPPTHPKKKNLARDNDNHLNNFVLSIRCFQYHSNFKKRSLMLCSQHCTCLWS